MNPKRARTLLILAIALSLLLHLFLAGVFRWPVFRQQLEQPAFKVRIMRIAHVTATPIPTPRPTPRVTPRVLASIAPPVVHAHPAKGPAQPAIARSAAPARTAPPSPHPARTPGCASSQTPPSVQSTPDVPDIGAAARAAKVSGTSGVQVTLDAQGDVTGTSIAQSSGSTALDAVAMEMAHEATYAPAYAHCKPVAASYLFTVKFVAL